MEMHKISIARIAKNIAYFLVPIFVVLLVASIAGLIIMDSDINIKNTSNYYETKLFSDTYMNSISNGIYHIRRSVYSEENDYQIYDNKKEAEILGKKSYIYYYNSEQENFLYLVIDNKNKIAVTNVELTMNTDTIEKIKSEISRSDRHWNYEDGKITTNIANLSMENVRYKYLYSAMSSSNISSVYTSILNELPYNDMYQLQKLGYDFALQSSGMAPYLIPISLVALVSLAIVIIHGIGKRGNSDRIFLGWFDKWPLEIALFLSFIIVLSGLTCYFSVESGMRVVIITGITIGAIISYLGLILMLETVVRRIKTHTLFKSTLIHAMYRTLKKLIINRKITTKLVLSYGGFLIISIILLTITYKEGVGIHTLMLMGFWLSIFIIIVDKLIKFNRIQEALKSIYEGNTNIKLNPNEMTGVLKELSIYISDIAGGLSNAVNESLKSERLKTELITNVSHDIKTPLTSIINYVDLLKKEEMPNEKCAEYLEILESKSQRLKKLTEDLVEASKASSGNIKLNMEKLNVNELIKQVSGEFEDRFNTKGLEEVMTLPEENVYIYADSRYMYRVLENMYSNISKYALENTRVYIDIIPQQTSVVIQMKNVSKEKLNIGADELMQRFVRGESSRNTEGSGLGLSIATSLTELQGGKFHIYLDGDLFKVTIGFEIRN